MTLSSKIELLDPPFGLRLIGNTTSFDSLLLSIEDLLGDLIPFWPFEEFVRAGSSSGMTESKPAENPPKLRL